MHTLEVRDDNAAQCRNKIGHDQDIFVGQNLVSLGGYLCVAAFNDNLRANGVGVFGVDAVGNGTGDEHGAFGCDEFIAGDVLCIKLLIGFNFAAFFDVSGKSCDVKSFGTANSAGRITNRDDADAVLVQSARGFFADLAKSLHGSGAAFLLHS